MLIRAFPRLGFSPIARLTPLPASVFPCRLQSLLLVKHIPLVQSESGAPPEWRTDRYRGTHTVLVSSARSQHTQLRPVFGHQP